MENEYNSFLNKVRKVRGAESGINVVDLLIWLVITSLILAAVINGISGISKLKSAQNKGTTAPVPSAPAVESAPATRSAPVDFPWAVVLGIGLSAILVVALVALIVWFVRKNNASMIVSKNNIAGWEKLMARHRELRMQWASYELDMAKLIDFPLMTDMREPVTLTLHKALKKAADLEPSSAKKMAAQPVVNSDFWNAVNDLDAAFHTAEHTAKKVAWSRFTPSERKSLATAKNLLALALDSGASPAERQAAYKRVFKELKGLIEFPEKARLEIEARHQLALAA